MARFKTFRVEADGSGVKTANHDGIANTTTAINDLRADSPGVGYDEKPHHFLPDYVAPAARATYPRQEGGR